MSYHNDFECYCPEEDEFAEYFGEMQIYYHNIEKDAKSKIWTTKNGTKIAVKDMTDNHIQNAINFIKRKDKHDYYLPWLKVLEDELKTRRLNFV